MAIKVINEKISYIEASNNPLSADIGIIKDGQTIWLYDVGCGEHSLNEISKCPVNVVLSHFHQDHTGNIEQIQADAVYASKETCSHIGKGTIVEEDLYIGGIHIFPLPSSHCKGSVGMEIDGQYAFVGDGLYCRAKAGEYVYNAQLLKEEIELLRGLQASYLLVSHHEGLVRSKEEVLAELELIYSEREKGNPFIKVSR